MNIDTWAIVIATFVGPIAAVIITRINDDRRARRERKLTIFRILMGNRRMHFNLEHIHALNLIEVEFTDDEQVVEAWRRLYEHFNKEVPQEQAQQWDSELSRLKGNLLSKMADSLGYKVTTLDLFLGGYSPRAYGLQEERQQFAFKYFQDLATGKASFPVRIAEEPHNRGN